MAARFPDDDRLSDLLATRAIEGLNDAEQSELNDLAAHHVDFDPEDFDRVAASLALSGLRVEPMPAKLRARVEADAEAWLAGRAAPAATPATITQLTPRQRPAAAWGGWFAAAAALLLAFGGWWQAGRMDQASEALAARQASLEQSVAQLGAALADKDAALAALREPAPAQLLAALEARPGTVVLPWSATDDPSAGGAEGAVVWNGAEQAGVMRFSGLQPNDPAVAQYQLWIFDAERDDRFPVDGGVFDVAAGADETLVPIRARLPVGQAVLFAITVEAPGGVVVSSRERIALVAQPGA